LCLGCWSVVFPPYPSASVQENGEKSDGDKVYAYGDIVIDDGDEYLCA
jgi:hypothetical protein